MEAERRQSVAPRGQEGERRPASSDRAKEEGQRRHKRKKEPRLDERMLQEVAAMRDHKPRHTAYQHRSISREKPKSEAAPNVPDLAVAVEKIRLWSQLNDSSTERARGDPGGSPPCTCGSPGEEVASMQPASMQPASMQPATTPRSHASSAKSTFVVEAEVEKPPLASASVKTRSR